MPEFWIWQGYEYARVTKGSKYATVWLNMSEKDMNTPEYVLVHNNRQGSAYVPYNTSCEVTLQVHEYFLRDMHIHKPEFWMCMMPNMALRHGTNYWIVIETEKYSEHCQAFKMERFAKRIMRERRCASSNFSGQGKFCGTIALQ